MMNWLHYLAEANIYLGVFYLAYCLFLIKETYYQLTRAYLLFACAVSFILPVLQIGALKPVKTAVTVTINYTKADDVTLEKYVPSSQPIAITPTQTASPVQIIQQPMRQVQTTLTPQITKRSLTIKDYLLYGYFFGACIVFVVLLLKLTALFKLIRTSYKENRDGHTLVYLQRTNAAFSFFNYLFIGADVAGADTIIRHELVHIRQKHSADIIFLELLKIINWFNPFVYLLQTSLKTVHEYIADEQTAVYETDAITYSSFLVNNAYGANNSSLTHSFFNYNLLKKRIIMLNKQRSGNLARLKYLVALPICAALLCSSTLAISKTYVFVDLDPANTNAAKALINKPAAKTNLISNTEAGDNPILTDATDNGDIAQAGDKIDSGATKDTSRNVITDAVGRLPLPSVNSSGYQLLDRYVYKNIHYTYTPNEKGGIVVVGFTLDNDQKITNLKIETSGGEKLDALAIQAFRSYKGVVNDAPGKSLKIGLYFFTGDYSIFENDKFGNDPGNSGALIITKYPHNFAKTVKGYEYNESAQANGNRVYATQVTIFDKDGEAKTFRSESATPAQVKLLKDKYGYEFPTNRYLAMELLPPGSYGKYMINDLTVSSYLKEGYTTGFYDHIYNNLQYPEKEKNDHTTGIVLVKFNVDQSGTISNAQVAKSGGDDFDEAAVKAVKSFNGTVTDQAGQHSVAIVFCAAFTKQRPIVGASFKQDGYIGELARAEKKSPFAFSNKNTIKP